MASLIYKPVLVINASYEPLEITSVRDALKKLVTRKAVMEIEHDREVYRGMHLPSVIRLVELRRVPHHGTRLTKKNLLLRDHYRCQYCGERFKAEHLTLDHVTPQSRGGPSSWENLVMACRPCNHRKGNKTPDEAGMTLRHKPRRLTIHTSKHIMRWMGMEEDERWGKYLYA